MIGRCLCGGVRYQVRCRPDALYYCHCSQCRRSSGSSFATNIAVARADLDILEGAELIKAYMSAPRKHRNFCSNCGSPLYSEYLDEPDVVYLRAGTLEDTGELTARAHIHTASMASWFEIRDGLPQYPEDADVDRFP
ncbi:MAG: GFA family protein [Arenicellales bacterium]|jgi:hypothetical protein